MMTLKNVFFVLVGLLTISVSAQFAISGELRTRTEFRQGYKTLFPNDTDPAFFTAQRTRLNSQYKTDKLKLMVSIQDVRTWGDVGQLNVSDKNGLALHQAYAELTLANHLSLKLGRQELVYDNARFLGNVDWTTQGRSHDALLLKWDLPSTKIDLGMAYNQPDENLINNTYTLANSYKTFQYVWVNHKFKALSASFLFFNNGLQYTNTSDASQNETRFSQTTGLRVKYGKNKFSTSSNLYYQMGKDVANNKLNAYLLNLDLGYQVDPNLNLTIGGELLSGNKNGTIQNQENNAFNPLYGTNHKFNGHMDYFYVGNHSNNVGLLDVNLTANLKLGSKSSITGYLHHFTAAEEINMTTSKNLGIEVDLAYQYQFADYGTFTLGYSQLFAQEGLEYVKNNFDGNTNHWAFAMLTLKPTFLK